MLPLASSRLFYGKTAVTQQNPGCVLYNGSNPPDFSPSTGMFIASRKANGKKQKQPERIPAQERKKLGAGGEQCPPREKKGSARVWER
jgi:hypothetical protein